MDKFYQYIETMLPLFLEKSISLSEIKECAYYALKGGKRIRSLIYLLTVDSLIRQQLTISDTNISLINDGFIYLELIHNASLILDDMPHMDNDLYRRGIPTVHHKYGKAKAQLTAFILTELAHQSLSNIMIELYQNGYLNQEKYCNLHVFLYQNQYQILGERGLAGGQYLDLYSIKQKGTLEDYLKMIEYKTARLFEMSLIIPYCLVNSSQELNHEIFKQFQRAGYLIGMIFQILDDLVDYCPLKSNGNNILDYLDKSKVKELIDQYYQECLQLLTKINIDLTDIFTIILINNK